jgi:hypothetical protein
MSPQPCLDCCSAVCSTDTKEVRLRPVTQACNVAAPPLTLFRFVPFPWLLLNLHPHAAGCCCSAVCSTETKEVRLRPVTESHDYEVKVASARKFLTKGSKVKLTMQFSGRELRFKDQGKEMMLVSGRVSNRTC